MVRDRDCGLFVNSPITLIAHKNSAFFVGVEFSCNIKRTQLFNSKKERRITYDFQCKGKNGWKERPQLC